MSNKNSPYFGFEDTPLSDSDDEDLSNDLQGGEKNQRHPMAKFIRFTVIGSLIGGFGLAGIAVVIGMPGEFLVWPGGIGAALGAIIGAVIGSPPWLYYVSEIFDIFG